MSYHMEKLMGNPGAQRYYAAISKDADPLQLAEMYTRLCHHDDATSKNVSLAIECHLRDLAVLHFERADVLRAVELMEKHHQWRSK